MMEERAQNRGIESLPKELHSVLGETKPAQHTDAIVDEIPAGGMLHRWLSDWTSCLSFGSVC